jgi:hypothetical protein
LTEIAEVESVGDDRAEEHDIVLGSPDAPVPPLMLETRGTIADPSGVREIVHVLDVGLRVRQLANARGDDLSDEEVERLSKRMIDAHRLFELQVPSWPTESRRVRAVRHLVDRLLGDRNNR